MIVQKDIEIAKRVREAVTDLGLTFKEVAKATYYNPSTVRDYVSGRRRITTGFLASFIAEYDIDAYYILYGMSRTKLREVTFIEKLNESFVAGEDT